jgi:hypothetical protein
MIRGMMKQMVLLDVVLVFSPGVAKECVVLLATVDAEKTRIRIADVVTVTVTFGKN